MGLTSNANLVGYGLGDQRADVDAGLLVAD